MKIGQTLTKNGYQVLLFPMEVMNITQGNNVGTHLGTNALDNAGKDTGIDQTIAPCDMKLVAYDSAKNGNAVFFESLNKVYFRDGSLDYATFMFIHDNNIEDIKSWAKSGKTWKQGQTFGDEGAAGYATGNHCHMEVAKGKYSHMYDRNAQGTYHLPNNVSADLAFVTDGTTIKNKGSFANWADSSVIKVSTPSTPNANSEVLNAVPNDFIKESATFYPSCTIKIRRAPSLKGQDTGLVYEKGMSVGYDGYVRREGYIWISWISATENTRRWMAAGETNSKGINTNPYGTFK